MLEYRGLDVIELDPYRYMTVNDLQDDITNQQFLNTLTIQLPDIAVYFFVDLPQERLPEVKRHTICVSINPPRPQALKQLPTNAVAFSLNELLINPTKHELVPRHELVDDEAEIKEVLNNLKVQFTQLPKIFVTDPMARYVGARSGDLMRITRVEKLAGEYVVYRAVI